MERENDGPTVVSGGMDSGTLADLLGNCRNLPLRLRLIDERTGKVVSEHFVTGRARSRDGKCDLSMTSSDFPGMNSAEVAELLPSHGSVIIHVPGRDSFSPTLTGTAIDQRMSEGTLCCVLSLVAG